MEKNDLVVYRPDVTYQKAPVLFTNFEAVRAQALEMADFVSSIVVTDDTVKAAKKMISETRKVVKGLDSKRLEIKRQILEDYELFETQVKELKIIVDDADKVVRDQVKSFEEQERQEKKEKLREIFKKRFHQYDLNAFFDSDTAFERWIRANPSALNKTVSLTKAEVMMTDWLEMIQGEVETLSQMPDNVDYYAEYFKDFDLSRAIKTVQENAARKQQMKESLSSFDNQTDEPTWKSISIYCNAEDYKRAKNILQSAGFDVA